MGVMARAPSRRGSLLLNALEILQFEVLKDQDSSSDSVFWAMSDIVTLNQTVTQPEPE